MADFKRTMLHESSVLTARVIKSTRSVFRNARTCYGVRDVTRLSAGEIAKKQRGEFELIRWEKKKKKTSSRFAVSSKSFSKNDLTWWKMS